MDKIELFFKHDMYIAKSITYLNLPKHLTEAQNNILNVMLTKVPITGSVDFVDFTFPEIFEWLGITKKDIGWLRSIFDTMIKIVIPVKDKDGIMIGSPVSDIQYIENSDIIRFHLSKTAKRHFTNFRDKDTLELREPYGKVLVLSAIFLSPNTVVIWNIITGIKNKEDKTILKSYEEWRSLLEICDNEYSEFNDFNRNILISIKKQIHERTGIKIEWELLRIDSKKVNFIRLVIVSIEDYEKPPAFQTNDDLKINTDDEVIKLSESLKKTFTLLTEEQIELLTNYYPAQKIYAYIYMVKNRQKSANEVWQPERVLMKEYYAFHKKLKRKQLADRKLIKPRFKIPIIKNFKVNNLAEQTIIKEILLNEFPMTEKEIRLLIVNFQFKPFMKIIRQLRQRIEEKNPFPHPQAEILRHYEHYENEKKLLKLDL